MTKTARNISHILLALLSISLALIAILRLYPLVYDFDTVAVPVVIQDRPSSLGKKFDDILLDKIQSFNYIKSFAHVFENGTIRKNIAQDFFIDRCEVSQNDFRVFTNWLKLNKNKSNAIKAPGQPSDWQYSSNTQRHIISGKLTAPANGITYYDAYAYCKAAGGRLPFENEWIAAASGHAGRLYPWGNTYHSDSAPYLDPLLNATQKCAAHPSNATPNGIFDMAGSNVSEWTSNSNSPLKPILVGGNAYNQPPEIYNLNALYRFAPSTYRSPYVGFRCVYPRQTAQTPWRKKITSVKIDKGNYSVGIPADARLPKFLLKTTSAQLNIAERIFSRPQNAQEKVLYVMRGEVTREQYNRFLHDPFAQIKLYADQNEPKGHRYQPHNWNRQLKNMALPVVNVDWWSAYAFSRWAGGRLPSAEEWAVVASSLGKHVYPWGNTPDIKQITNRIQRTKLNALDQTDHGIFDMGSNVSEWTQSVTNQNGKYAIVTKGGNYLLPYKETALINFNNFVSPHYQSPALGIRLVFDEAR